MLRIGNEELDELRNSALFDEKYYLEQYPDVKMLGIDPLEHYLWVGARIGRNPSSAFDTNGYLDLHLDVSDAGVNPLLHYVRWGNAEGRETVAVKTSSFKTAGHKHKLKVAVVAWDVGHNPVGRAYLIAEALSRRFEVELIGPQFPRFGDKVWEPVQNGKMPVISFPGRYYPDFEADIDAVAARLDCDAIVVCKPRMPSLQLGLVAKHKLNRPLILDIDDHELAFCSEFATLDLEQLQVSNAADIHEPYASTWTRFAETLVPHADAVLVSNEALQREFGGTIIPHARDEHLFDPTRYDKNQCRKDLGLAAHDKVVLFAGTARAHKGLVEIANAVGAIDRQDCKLCIVGDILDRGLKARIMAAAADKVVFFPNQPLEELPRFLAAADLVCLLQNQDSRISQFQLPAKLVDALAMGVPVLATETAPLRPFIECGSVIPVTTENLQQKLEAALSELGTLGLKQRGNRSLFLGRYSYQAVAEKLEAIVLSALKKPKPLPKQALDFRQVQKSLARHPDAPPPARRHEINMDGRYDLVMFWKQHDAGVYGRRSDMLAKYFAKHRDIRQVLFIDPPLWHGDLVKRSKVEGVNEHGVVYREILARSHGLRDRDNLSFHTFIYHPGDRHQSALWPYPKREQYLEWLGKLFADHGVVPHRSIFWLFPVNEVLRDVVGRFRPKFVVTDVVDDQREQPGIPDARRMACERNYKELCALSDLIVTNCAPVQESISSFGRPVRLLPNACEVDPPEERPDHDLRQLLAIPQPRLGYVGNLESKLDIELLEHMAITRPDWNIVLVGSAHTRSDILALDHFPNVHFMGVVPYDEARLWMRHFDVALMPHLNTPLTRTMNPLKLFVYLAQRIPVVSTTTPNTDEMGDLIHVATSKEQFVALVDKILRRELAQDWSALQDKMNQHSWDSRVNSALNWLGSI